LIALFKQKAPGTIAILFITALLLKLPLFTRPALMAAPSDGPLYRMMARRLSAQPSIASGLIAFGVLFLGAVIINYLVNQYRMTSRQTFLPALAYLLITSLVPEWSLLSAPLVAGTVLLLAFTQIYRLYGAPRAGGRIYNIGLLTGIAGFIWAPALIFGVMALIGLMVLRPFRAQELLLFLVGVATPTYFYGIGLFLYDQLNWKLLVPQLHFGIIERRPGYSLLGSIILLVLPFLQGAWYVQGSLRKMLIQARKNWSLLLFWLLLALGMPFFGNDGHYTGWVLVAAPLAAFHACAFFYPPRRWVPLVLFFLILTWCLALQYGVMYLKK
jgi:hypothetical protein